MKTNHIYLVFLLFFSLFSKVICEPRSARSEYFLGYDLVTNLVEEGELDRSDIFSTNVKNQIKTYRIGSRDYMKILFENLQNNEILFDNLYNEGDDMNRIIQKAENTRRFKNGLDKSNLYQSRHRSYKNLLSKIIMELEECYTRTNKIDILNNLKSNLEKIRDERFGTMKRYYNRQPMYRNNGVTIDETNHKFLLNNQEFDLDNFNNIHDIRRPKIDNTHYSIVKLTREKAISVTNTLNSNIC